MKSEREQLTERINRELNQLRAKLLDAVRDRRAWTARSVQSGGKWETITFTVETKK